MLRIADDSGQDYLYPMACFVDLGSAEAFEKRRQ